jgi:hypothetical protein
VRELTRRLLLALEETPPLPPEEWHGVPENFYS